MSSSTGRETLQVHTLAFLPACNFAKHLKAACHAWTTTPEISRLTLRLLIPELNTGS